MDADFERLKVICSWEDGQGKRIPVSRIHGDKRIGEFVCSVNVLFKRVGMLNLRKSCILQMKFLKGLLIDLSCQT